MNCYVGSLEKSKIEVHLLAKLTYDNASPYTKHYTKKDKQKESAMNLSVKEILEFDDCNVIAFCKPIGSDKY